MDRYKLTGRGWLLIIIIGLLLSTGAYALVSSFGGGEAPPEPSGPQLEDLPTPVTPPVPTPVQNTPSPEPPLEPDPTPTESPSPTPDPSPISVPSPVPDPSPVPIPDPSQPPPEPSPKPPEPSPPPAPSWAEKTNAVMFNFDSAEPSETRERILAALDELIPSPEDLTEYIIVVEAYASGDETAEGLAQQRAGVVADMIVNDLGIPAAMVREQSGDSSDGEEAWRQRADVYFAYVGVK